MMYIYICVCRSYEAKRHEIQDFYNCFSSLIRGLGRHWGEIRLFELGEGERVDGDFRSVRGSRGTPGVSKWVNRDVRGFMGSRGTPRGSRGIRGVVKVSQGMKRGLRGVPGDPKGLRWTS